MLPISPKMLAGVALASALFGAGWYVRAQIAMAAMAEFQLDLAAQAQDQRELKAKVEASQAKITQQSTARLDQQDATTQKEVQYVEREVVQFRDRWRDRACVLPAEWVRLYHVSLGVGDPMPSTAEAGPAPAGAGL